jgi:[acyl-carrier-protein] S-malonyltransferase
MSFAFVFPGQGSQSVGMLAALGAEPLVRETFEEASGVLGYDLWQLVQQGPAERLNATEQTQPAMLAAGVALWRLWRQRGGVDPVCMAGHSLGEFTALVCAGALQFGPAVNLVRTRGALMQQAVPPGAGAMAAILGLEEALVEESCRSASAVGIVEAVNFNGPGQVVIAGARAAVMQAMQEAQARGSRRAVELPISVPSHSSLMRPAAEQLRRTLAEIAFVAPRVAFLSAVDATAHAEPADIRELLSTQLARPVRWQETVRALAALGIRQLIECGPGKVLTAMNRRIERRPDLACLAVEDSASLDAALAAVRAP